MDIDNRFNSMDSPTRELIEIIFSVNEEITEENIASLNDEIEYLCNEFQSDKILFTLLKMIRSLGKYLEQKKSNCHPDALDVLNSLINRLDNIASNPEIPQATKTSMMYEELNKFNELKQEITPQAEDKTLVLKLKAILLSLEWEIKDETISAMDETIEKIKPFWHTDHVLTTFLDIISKLGEYIGTLKAKAHPKSIPFLHFIYNNMEALYKDPDMDEDKRIDILNKNRDQYDLFKEKAAELMAEDPAPVQKNTIAHVEDEGEVSELEMDAFVPLDQEDNHGDDFESYGDVEPVDEAAEPGNKDVMDDLFNPKESPVDELLDKIHQQNLMGLDNQESIPGATEEAVPEGMKKVVPQHRSSEPIQEINDKLEAFFDLDQAQEEKEEDFFEGPFSEDDDSEDDAYFQDEQKPESSEPLPEQPDYEDMSKDIDMQVIIDLKYLVDKALRDVSVENLQNIKTKIQKLQVIYKKNKKLSELISILNLLNTLNLQVLFVAKKQKVKAKTSDQIKEFWGKLRSSLPSSK